ncbi:MAG: MFS transporter [Propionibacteriaceae bacterium]|nr:MFS transporter [Propionibacteriaceae bacterium]
MANDPVFPSTFVAPLYMGATFNPINSSLIATALVWIATAMKVPAAQATILVTVFYLASTIAQPAAGKLSEVFGPRRVFLVGIVVLMVGAVVGGLGMNMSMLVVSRTLIGLGTSASYPAAMTLIRQRADSAGLSEPPSRVLGLLQISGSVTSVVGLPLGGVLVGLWGWRTSFWINIPFTVIALVMALRWIPETHTQQHRTAREIYSELDGTGILGFIVMMVALLVFLFTLPRISWVAIIVTVVFLAFLVWWELRRQRPFIDVRLIATNMPLLRVYLRFAGLMLCVFTIIYGLTQWLEVARGLDPSLTGLLVVPMSLVSTILAWFVSRSNMIRATLVIAGVFSLAASAGVFFLTTSSPIVLVILITVLFGITMGTMTIGNQTALYALVPADEIGTASGLFRTAGYIGTIASSAIINLVFAHAVSDTGVHHLGITMVIVSLIVLLLTFTDRWVMRSGAAHPGT